MILNKDNIWEVADGIDFVPLFTKKDDINKQILASYTKEGFLKGVAYPKTSYLYWKDIDGNKVYLELGEEYSAEEDQYKLGYQQALKDINNPMKMIMPKWGSSECPRCGNVFYEYETCNDGFYKRAKSLDRCPYCGQKIEWE